MERVLARLAARSAEDRGARMVAAGIAVGAVTLTSWIGAAATAPALEAWYPALAKPSFTPPNWAFPVAWTTLFAMMAWASWLVWRNGGAQAWPALQLYATNLALNALWSAAFFGFQSPGAGLVALAPFLVSIVACILAFRPHSMLAAALMIPYFAWVSFAAALNAAIWWIN